MAFAVGGLQEILRDVTPDLLIAPGDTPALIARVKEVLAGHHAQKTNPSRLRAYVEQRYSPAAMVARTLDLYQSAKINATRSATG
ncbi:hypothetical protein VSR34_35000 [Paraburkholderia sp. JHI2823]|uniref:glycosyltransferase n=1 Tax=Paraburkholderia sp. JHI2823 TaxID=3112960 RepID=UPI00316D2DCA